MRKPLDVKESEDSIAFRHLMSLSGSKKIRKKKKELEDAVHDAIEKWFQENTLHEIKLVKIRKKP